MKPSVCYLFNIMLFGKLINKYMYLDCYLINEKY